MTRFRLERFGMERHFYPVSWGAAITLSAMALSQAEASTIAPPMLDITHQCDLSTHHNVTAMSECVVAESEARSNLLQHWDKLPNDDVGKCIKISRKAKRQPYTAMEKCLAADLKMPTGSPKPVSDVKK